MADVKGFIKKLLPKKTKNDASFTVEEKVYCPPEKDISRRAEILGTAFRGTVVFCALFGLTYLFFQSIGLYTGNSDYRFYSLDAWYMVKICLLFTALATVAPVNRVTRVAVPLGTLAFLTAVAASKGNPLTLVENSVRFLYNTFILHVVKEGYIGMIEYVGSEKYSFSDEMLTEWGVVFFVLVFAVLLSFCAARRSNTVVFLLTVIPPVAILFFFNIVVGNLGFAFIVASVASFLSMRIVDMRYGGGTQRRIRKKREKAERKMAAKEERGRRRVASLRLKNAADHVYGTAIDAEMGARRARAARRAVIKRARAEERYLKEEQKRLEKERAKALKEEERARRNAEKEKAKLRRDTIRAERRMPEDERRAAKTARVEREKKESENRRKARQAEKAQKREMRRENARKSRRNRAAGGYAAIAAALIALAATAFPFAVSKKPFPTIGFIDNGMKKIRMFATDLLVGDGVDLTGDPYGSYEKFGYEKIDFSPRSYDGTMIFRVEAPSMKTVYLKSRTALGYDNLNDKWLFADEDAVIKMRGDFGRGFTSDTVTRNAYSFLFPLSDETPSKFATINYEKYGFSVEQVHVMRINGGSRLLFVPSVMNPETGILEYRTTEETEYKYTAFYDGIYTSRYFGVGEDGYSSVSYVYTMTDRDLGDALAFDSRVIDNVYSYAVRWDEGEDIDELHDEYMSKVSEAEATLGEKFFTEYSSSKRRQFIKAVELEHKYREYAENTYTETSGSERIAALAAEIFTDENASRYDRVMAVIDYLTKKNTFRYTLNPPQMKEGTDLSAIEYFLFGSKNGYCCHFATSAALLLREAGIPVRYAEGYHVSGFAASGGNGAADRYGVSVRDRDSHTWIEVYFDDVGWVPFETTLTFTEYDKEPSAPIGNTDIELPDDGKDDTKDQAETTAPTNQETSARVGLDLEVLWKQYRVYFIWAFWIIGTTAVIWIAVALIRKSAESRVRRRRDRIAKIRNDEHFRDPATDRRGDAKYLIDSLFTVFEAVDIGPEKGEQLSEFARRLSEDYFGLSTKDPGEVMECVLKEEFGHGLTFGETELLATYVDDVLRTIYAGMTWREKIKYRYIKRII